jgi:hypothetical protein
MISLINISSGRDKNLSMFLSILYSKIFVMKDLSQDLKLKNEI